MPVAGVPCVRGCTLSHTLFLETQVFFPTVVPNLLPHSGKGLYLKTQGVTGEELTLSSSLSHHCQVREAIISHGCTVEDSTVDRAVVGLRLHVGKNCLIRVSVVCVLYTFFVCVPRAAGEQ